MLCNFILLCESSACSSKSRAISFLTSFWRYVIIDRFGFITWQPSIFSFTFHLLEHNLNQNCTGSQQGIVFSWTKWMEYLISYQKYYFKNNLIQYMKITKLFSIVLVYKCNWGQNLKGSSTENLPINSVLETQKYLFLPVQWMYSWYFNPNYSPCTFLCVTTCSICER